MVAKSPFAHFRDRQFSMSVMARYRPLRLGKQSRVPILSMRTAALLAAMVVLAAASAAAQIATGIGLADVRVRGDTQLEAVDLSKCAADLRSRIYQGPEWLDDLAERVRVLCLQDNGYFKATVKASAQQLPDKQSTHQFVITFEIDAGPIYRTGQIAFRSNYVFSTAELHSIFKVEAGDIFSPAKILEALERMRRTYVERHYLNFTVVPETSIDDSRHIISMVIDCDEGQQFR